jgi:hypothetical protein
MNELKLYMLLIGGRPKGRLTEQHDIFFGIGHSLKELIPHIKLFWPEIKSTFHLDAWREVSSVNGYNIRVVQKQNEKKQEAKLFFLNLGGYKPDEFEELHYKMLAVANSSGEAIQRSKQTAFYKHIGFKGAPSHVDEKYGVDVDDIYNVKDILPDFFRERYSLIVAQENDKPEDQIHLGYIPLKKIE